MYLFYLYSAKYRLRFVDENDRECIAKNIKERIINSKSNYNNLSFKQKLKILIYKYFNKVAFFYKYKKEVKVN